MIASLYFCGALASSGIWLSAFLKDESTPKSDTASWVVLVIATILWPVAVPLAIRERSTKNNRLLLMESSLDLDIVTES